MGRWRRHLDPSVKKDAWTGAEDDKLMRLHDTLGPRWSNISKMLTGRTAQQCRARWFQLSAADDDATDGNASDATDGATVVTVTVGVSGDEKLASISRKKKMGGAEKKTLGEHVPEHALGDGRGRDGERGRGERGRRGGRELPEARRRRGEEGAQAPQDAHGIPSRRRPVTRNGAGGGGILRQRRGTRHARDALQRRRDVRAGRRRGDGFGAVSARRAPRVTEISARTILSAGYPGWGIPCTHFKQ